MSLTNAGTRPATPRTGHRPHVDARWVSTEAGIGDRAPHGATRRRRSRSEVAGAGLRVREPVNGVGGAGSSYSQDSSDWVVSGTGRGGGPDVATASP